MESETVANYLADSINLDGIRSDVIKTSLAADVQVGFGHPTKIAERIKQLEGHVPGSSSLAFDHSHIEKRDETTDVVGVIEAVIEDEKSAIKRDKQMTRDTDGKDYVTQ
ncbi:MAG: bacterioferritin [Mariniblastus sp.]|jgi:bacterioferritin